MDLGASFDTLLCRDFDWCGRRRRVPVVQHLECDDHIEREPGHEAIKDELVVDFLERGEDASERAGKVAEDLEFAYTHVRQCSRSKGVFRRRRRRGEGRYRKSAQLASATLFPGGKDLGNFARDAQDARPALQISHHGLVDERFAAEHQCVDDATHSGEERAGGRGLAGEDEHKRSDDDVLQGNQGRFAIGAERELLARIVCEGDEETRRFERVRGERNARRRARGEKFEDLRHFYDSAKTDDDEAQDLGNCKRKTCWVLGDIDREDKGGEAVVAQQRDEGIVDGLGQRDGGGPKVRMQGREDVGLKRLLERLHCEGDTFIHVGCEN